MSSCSNKKPKNPACNKWSGANRLYKFVVKIQKSIHTTGNKAQLLIYNEDKSILHEMEVSKDIEDLLNGKHKAYFNAFMDDNGLMSVMPGQLNDINW
jgi:hypothetical protein